MEAIRRGNRAEFVSNDPVAARVIAVRTWDRILGTAPSTLRAKLKCKPRWRERISEIEISTLVVHGRRDLPLPAGSGEAIAREIPGVWLLAVDDAATAARGLPRTKTVHP